MRADSLANKKAVGAGIVETAKMVYNIHDFTRTRGI